MKKILLIEDNDDIRINTAEILGLSNYEVIVAENDKTGIQKAIEHTPDLIICDIMMPVLDGYGVLHAIHRNEGIKNTPFIFLTAKTERNDLRKGMELGADDYITKPFSGTELLNAVDSRMKKIELLKQDLSPGLDGMQHLIKVSYGIAMRSITENRSVNSYKKREKIYSEGNHPNRLYYILSGKIKTYKIHDDGKELVTQLFSQGDFLGYVALLEKAVYKDTAEALEDSEVIAIPKDDFEDLVYNNPEVTKKFIQLLAQNISTKEDQLLGLAYNSLRRKVAYALLALHNKYKKEPEEKFIIDISRDNLANIAGTATESLIRTLSDFRFEKLIEIQDGKISILNKNRLEHLLN